MAVTPSDSNFKGPVGKDKTGFNGQTGAPATWNPSKSLWIDANGVEIRDDAIVPNAPPAAAPAPPVAGGPGAGPVVGGPAAGSGGLGTGPKDMPASMSALGSMMPSPAATEPMSGGGLNPNLGRRIYPESMRAIASLGRKAY